MLYSCRRLVQARIIYFRVKQRFADCTLVVSIVLPFYSAKVDLASGETTAV